MTWQSHIVVNPDVLSGKPIIKGTRIAVEFVVDLLGRGWTTEDVLREYDHLTKEDVQACLDFDNCREVEKDKKSASLDKLYEILNRRHSSRHTDTAERHNEHQP